MKALLLSSSDDKVIAHADAEPECGVDFCDTCGDCLACYPCHEGEICPGSVWIIYEYDERAKEIEWIFL